MSKQLPQITPELQDFIKNQKIFFVGTAAQDGRVNVSPKGHDTLRVLSSNKLVWLNLTGSGNEYVTDAQATVIGNTSGTNSGNETAAHLLKNDRMTIMFCAFEGNPLILRLYGNAKIYHERDDTFHKYINLFEENTGSRQIIELDIDLVQTSCGFSVPFMDFKEERGMLNSWSKKQDYWKEKNTKSIDGFDTDILSSN